MPVIKRGSRVVAAGDAANAFGQATAGQRDTTVALFRLKEQQQQFQARQAQRADYDNQRRLGQERSFQLQERRMESQNAAAIRNQLGRTSQYGAQVNGQSMIQMATRVSQLDQKAYKEMDQQFDALTGGVFNEQNPPTPEALDAHPKREAIYSLLGSYLAPLEKAADAHAIQKGYQELEQNVSHMGKDWLETADGVQWQSQLDQAIANANQSGAPFTGARAKAIYDEFQAKFTASIDLHERREFFRDRWADIARDPKYAAVRKTETWQRARNEMAGMGSATDPDTKFTKVMTMIDPDFELAAQLGYERGQKEGALGATAAQARIAQAEREAAPNFEAFLRQKGIPATAPQATIIKAAQEFKAAQSNEGGSGASSRNAEIMGDGRPRNGATAPLTEIDPQAMPGAAKALPREAPSHPVPAVEFIQSLDLNGVDLTDQEKVREHLAAYRASKAKRESEANARREAAIDRAIYGDAVQDADYDDAQFQKSLERNNVPDDPEAIEAHRVKYQEMKRRRRIRVEAGL